MNSIDEARALIQKRWVRGDDQAAADWVNEHHKMRFNRVSVRQFRLSGGSRHHAHFFIEAYNAVQRNRQKRQSRIKSNERTKQLTQQES